MHEASYDAIIRNNASRNNGFGSTWWGDGGGIVVASSPNVEIFNNTVVSNKNGVILYMRDRPGDLAPYGPHITANSSVHNNVIRMPGGYTGLIQHVNDNSYFSNRGNIFANNIYYLQSPSARLFHWMNDAVNKDKWMSFGHDTTGTFNCCAVRSKT